MTPPDDLPSGEALVGDPALLNRLAWASRWACRKRSVDYALRALTLAGTAEDPQTCNRRGRALVVLAWQGKWCGRFDQALQNGLNAESCLSEAEFPEQRAHVYSILGVVHYSRNRLDLASCAVDRGMLLVGPHKGTEAYVDLLTTRATVQRYHGDRSRAGLTIARARDIATDAELARVEHNVARWMLADEAPEGAAELAERALALADLHQNRVIVPYAYEVLGAAQAAMGEHPRAEKSFATGLAVAIEDDDRRAQCQIVERHAALELDQGNLDRARDLYTFGAEIAEELDYALWQRTFSLGLARVFEEMGDLKKALAEHRRAWNIENARRT